MEPHEPTEDEMTTSEQFHRLEDMVGTLADTVDKLQTSVTVMVEDSKLSREVTQANTAALTSSKRRRGYVIALLLAALVGGSVVVYRDHQQSDCIKRWAVATNNRSATLTSPAIERVSDLYGALGAASGSQLKGVIPLPSRAAQVDYIFKAKKDYPLLVPGDRASLTHETNAQLGSTYYLILGLRSNNDYVNKAQDNPVPQSPFNCSSF